MIRRLFAPGRGSRQLGAPLCALALASALLVGCSESYNGERLYWKAQQTSASVFKDPAHATPEQIRQAIQAFQYVVDKAPGTAWAGQANFAIGSLQLVQKDYDKARETYTRILQNYSGNLDLSLKARSAIAKSYELQGQWADAVKAYHDISTYHPWSKFGLEAPLYVAAVYQKRQQAKQAQEAFEQAVHFYLKMIPDAPRPEMAYAVQGYLALAYQRLGRWTDAVHVYEELAKVPAGPINRPLVLMTLGSLYQTKIKDAAKARAAYSQLVKEFPDHPFSKAARAQLEQGLKDTAAPAVPENAPVATVPADPVPPVVPAPRPSR